jgi:tRNA 2-thiocytidine biosynthesis protein TtcA
MNAVWIDEAPADATTVAAPTNSLKIERETHKLEKRLCREVGRAIVDYNMIEEGDKVMVCVSGGKDSYAMLDILLKLKARAPIHFDIVAVNLDQKQPGFPEEVLPKYLSELGVAFHIENQDTYSIVKRVIPEGKTTCGLCSRLRRGILYRVADELGATKVALGHHRDDMLQTFFLNMFFAGKLKSMPPKLVSDDGKHIVIRPLAYVAEKDLVRWAQHREFPIIPCTLCGSQENLQRKQVGEMLREWDKKHPGRVENMFTALQNVVPSHLLDGTRHDFKGLKATGVADDEGDKAFPLSTCSPRHLQPFASSRADPATQGNWGHRCPETLHETYVPSSSSGSSRNPQRLRHLLGGRQRREEFLVALHRAARRHLPLRAPAFAAGRHRPAGFARGDGRRGARQSGPAPRRRQAAVQRADRRARDGRALALGRPVALRRPLGLWLWRRLRLRPPPLRQRLVRRPGLLSTGRQPLVRARSEHRAARGGLQPRGLRNPGPQRRALQPERRPPAGDVPGRAAGLSEPAAGRAPGEHRPGGGGQEIGRF